VNGIDEINYNAYAALALCPDFNTALRIRPTRTIFNIPWANVTISIGFIQTSAYIKNWEYTPGFSISRCIIVPYTIVCRSLIPLGSGFKSSGEQFPLALVLQVALTSSHDATKLRYTQYLPQHLPWVFQIAESLVAVCTVKGSVGKG
jgi:hypothetical protein